MCHTRPVSEICSSWKIRLWPGSVQSALLRARRGPCIEIARHDAPACIFESGRPSQHMVPLGSNRAYGAIIERTTQSIYVLSGMSPLECRALSPSSAICPFRTCGHSHGFVTERLEYMCAYSFIGSKLLKHEDAQRFSRHVGRDLSCSMCDRMHSNGMVCRKRVRKP